MRKIRKRCMAAAKGLFLLALGAVCLLPVWVSVTGALREDWELYAFYAGIFGGGTGDAKWSFLPLAPTLKHLWNLLIHTPTFFVMFWNSVKLTLLILAGQLLFALPAAWALGRLSFPGKRIAALLYLVLMLMPFQVSMLPLYLTLKGLHLLDTHAGIILPAIFQTMPVFIMSLSFSRIPEDVLEAARLDGAGEGRIFLRIAIPLGMPGIVSGMLLSFIENWNMIEQPMTFLKTKTLWPLSMFAGDIPMAGLGEGFAASLLMLIPPLTVFLAGQDEIREVTRRDL